MTIDIRDLDADQRAVVDAQQRFRLIVGGAASGKSTVLGHCIAQALGAAPASTAQLLALAPTVQGATELQAQLDLCAPEARGRVQVMTIKDWCLALLREHGQAIGLPPDVPPLDALDDREARWEALGAALRAIGVSVTWGARIGLQTVREILLGGPKAFFRVADHAQWVDQCWAHWETMA